MTQSMPPTYTARICFKTCVRVDAHRGNPWFAGAELPVQKRVMADQIIATLIDNGAVGGVQKRQWQDVYDSLRRRWMNQ